MTQVAVELRAFDLKRDLERLRDWLSRPHVTRWWGDPGRVVAAVAKQESRGGHALILADGQALGYVRWQRVVREDLAAGGLDEIPDGAVDVDILIGEPRGIGRGIGSEALKLLLAQMRSDSTIPLVGMSVVVENAAAVRAYEKAGFRRQRRYEDPQWEPTWLMIAE